MTKSTLTRRGLADKIANTLAALHGRGLDHAVGVRANGDVDYCHEGGRTLAAVLVPQAMDTDSYGGGTMGPEDITAVADAFHREWLDEHNAGHDEDEQIEWAEVA